MVLRKDAKESLSALMSALSDEMSCRSELRERVERLTRAEGDFFVCVGEGTPTADAAVEE